MFQIFGNLDNSCFTTNAPLGDDAAGAALKFDSADYYPYVYCRVPSDITE